MYSYKEINALAILICACSAHTFAYTYLCNYVFLVGTTWLIGLKFLVHYLCVCSREEKINFIKPSKFLILSWKLKEFEWGYDSTS